MDALSPARSERLVPAMGEPVECSSISTKKNKRRGEKIDLF